MRLIRRLSLFLVISVATLSRTATAAVPPLPSPRVLGMGGALRGSATGDAAVALNPSGMSLIRSYVIEAAYTHDGASGRDANNGHVSIVDSTSGFNLAGGLYYTYLSDQPAAGLDRSGHEGGLALSFPIADKIFIGAAAKYLRLRTSGPIPPGTSSAINGFTFDAGITFRPISILSIGLAAQNLRDLETDRAPQTFGGGITVGAATDLLFGADAVMTRTPRATGGTENLWHFMAGGEYLVAKTLGVRAGGGRHGDTKAGYASVGLSLVSGIGALDVGFSRELSGTVKETLIGVSGRLFLPAAD